MKNVDFIFQQDARRILDLFTRLFNIRIVFFTYDGIELAAGENRQRGRFCQLFRQAPACDQKCRSLDRAMQLKSAEQESLVVYTCHAGMTEAVLPVFTENRLIGYIMIGQFRTLDTSQTAMLPSVPSDFDDDLAEAYQQTPCYSESQQEDILNLFSVLVEIIISRHLITISSDYSIQKLITFIDEHPETTLTVTEAAEMLNCSASTLTHSFKQTTGKSFKQYLLSRKMAKAEELLRSRKDLRIHQIASIVGYSDPYLFSRIFKKHRGQCPSAFLPSYPS